MSTVVAAEQPCINLTFHGVGEPTRALASGEQHVWISRDRLSAVLDAVQDRHDIRLSFDDGNDSDVIHALPELRRRGMRATFFVVAGRLGAPGFLAVEDLRHLRDAGMEIGCHGLTHQPWRRLDDRQLRDELLLAREIIERVIERKVTDAACPFGSYDRRVLRALRACGYRRVYTSDGGPSRPDRWLQARNTLHGSGGDGEVREALTVQPPRRQTFVRDTKLAIKRWR